jgi:hypothetical protein
MRMNELMTYSFEAGTADMEKRGSRTTIAIFEMRRWRGWKDGLVEWDVIVGFDKKNGWWC